MIKDKLKSLKKKLRRKKEFKVNEFDHSLFDSGEQIIKAAKQYVGQEGGQCKVFVYNLIKDLTGKEPPLNHPTDKWKWDMKRKHHSFIDTPNRKDVILAGDILQIKWKQEVFPKRRFPWHTTIVLLATGADYVFVDSNFYLNEIVRVHTMENSVFNEWCEDYTIYRLNPEAIIKHA